MINNIKITSLLAVLAFFACSSCEKKKAGNPVPYIVFESITPNKVESGNSEDSLRLTFHFSDGDADLGNSPGSGMYDIYTVDSRDNSGINYFFPSQLPDVTEPGDGIEGDCSITIRAAFLLLRPDHPDGDTLHYDVYIKDRAGHESNHIQTPDIYITP